VNQKKDLIIVLTRDKTGNMALAEELKGYSILLLPTFTIVPKSLDISIQELAENDLLVFTSVNALRVFIQEVSQQLPDSLWERLRVAIVGEKTAQLFTSAISPDAELIVANNVDALIVKLKEQITTPSKMLHFAGNLTLSIVKDFAKENNHSYEAKVVYENVPIKPNQEALAKIKEADSAKLRFLFFSPSAVRYTDEMLKAVDLSLKNYQLISFGASTTKEIYNLGLSLQHEVEESSVNQLLNYLTS
jgi:uroporphyrinogen-III synthase